MSGARTLPLATKAGFILAAAAGLPSLTLTLTGATLPAVAVGVATALLIPFWLWLLIGLLKPFESLATELSAEADAPTQERTGVASEAVCIRDRFLSMRAQLQTLQSSERKFRELFYAQSEASPTATLLLDGQSRLEYASPSFSAITGYPSAELGDSEWDRMLDPENRELFNLHWQDAVKQRNTEGRSLCVTHKSGEPRWLDVRIRVLEYLENDPRYLVMLHDFTAQKHALDWLHLERRKTLAVLDAVSDGVILMDEAEFIQYVNPVALQMIGKGTEEVLGRPLRESLTLRPHHPEFTNTGHSHALTLENPSGEQWLVEISVAPVRDEESGLASRVLLLKPLRERQTGTDRSGWAATHDWLTGLVNRLGFEQKLEGILKQGAGQCAPMVVALVDLDHFRQLNDEGGRGVGDEMLKQVASILMHNVRRCDLVARIGGDEFGLLLTGCDSPRAMLIVEGIRADLEKYRLRFDKDSYRVTASIGVTELAPADKYPQEVLRRADEGCCRAKTQGRNLVNLVQVAA